MKKNTLYIILALLFASVTTWAQTPMAAIEGGGTYATLQAAINAATDGQTVTVLADQDITALNNIEKNLTIDLNGKKLNWTAHDTHITGGVSVTIKKGTIDITGATTNADCIIGIGWYNTTANTLTLDGVTLQGDGYSSANGVLYAYANAVNTINVNNCTVNLKNEQASTGGVFKMGSTNDILNITGSEITLDTTVRGITTGTVTIKDSEFTMTNGDNGINQSNITIEDSQVTITDCTGRGITSNSTSPVVIKGNSTVTLANCDEGDIRLDAGSSVSVEDTSKLVADEIKDNGGTVASITVEETATMQSSSDVAKIGSTNYTSLQAAFDAATAGQTVTLLQDIDATSTMYSDDSRFNLWIKEGITVDGQNHKLTVKGRGIGVQGASGQIDVTFKDITVTNTGNANGRCIDTRGKLSSLTLDNATLTTAESSYTGYLQPLTIGGNQSDAATVNIVNGSQIITVENANKGYAITTFNPVNMTISGSTLKGWSCLNIKGQDSSAGSAGSVITVTNSTLTSANGTPGETNAYSLVKIEDDNVKVDITNSTLNVNGNDNMQAIVSFQKLSSSYSNSTVTLGEGNTVNFTGTTSFDNVEGSVNPDSKLEVVGGKYSEPVQASLISPKAVVQPTEDGYFVLKAYDTEAAAEAAAVAKIGDMKYATLPLAIEAVKAGETIFILNNFAQADHTTISKGGFTIDGQGNTMSCNTVTDPEMPYRNGEGALFFNTDGASLVTVKDLNIKGFAYAIDVEANDMAVTMIGGSTYGASTYGRAALNVHGNNNNFIFSGVEVHGLNNETNEGAEQFAAFVLDTDANDNTLTIENCPVTAFVKESGYNTEKFIELRGANNKVLVKGTTAYTCDPEEGAGFTNKSTDVANDKVYFDPAAKQQFQALFDKDTELEISDIETADKYSDLDVEGTYPLIASVPVVIIDNTDEDYMFSTIEKAFASDKFDATSSIIKLLGDVTLAEDFTMESGDMFTININGKKLNGGGKHIVLKPGAAVKIIGGATEEMAALFAAADEETTTILAYKDEGDYIFTAGNVVFDEIATLFTDVVDMDMLSNGSVVELKKDITMTEDLDLAAAGFTTGQSFTLKFAGKTLSGDKNIIIPDGVSVNTDKQTNIFTAANSASFILETANDDRTYTYSVSATTPADGIVRNVRTGYLYNTLQSAAAAAEEGDELTVIASEIKTAKQVDITKSLTIQGGEGSHLVKVTDLGEHPHYIDMLPLFNLKGLAEGSEVTIKDINMEGFAYGIKVEDSVQGVTVNLKSSSATGSPVQFHGRAAINNLGSNNTFNVDHVDVYTFNDEISTGATDYQWFAAFVDDKSAEEATNQYEAKNNTYNISNVQVTPEIGSGINGAMANSVKFIDLRGSGAKVRLVNTKYNYLVYSSEDDYHFYGFTNDAYVNLLGEDNNSVWFDAASKENLNKHVSLVPGLRIDDTEVAPGFWPLVRVGGGVRLIPDPDNAPNVAYHYDTLKEAIESDKFKIGHSTNPATGDVSDIYPQISLLSDQVIDEDINLPAEFAPMSEYRFNILLAEDIGDETVKHTVTTAEGKGIILPALVYANVNDGADGSVDGIFKAADGQLVICSQVDGAEKAYTAANVKYLAGGDAENTMFYVFDKLISDGILAADDKVVLMTNVALGGDITAPVAASEDFDIVFGEYDITGGSLKLVDGAAVNTDRQTTIFAPVDESHFIKESKNDDGTFRYEVLAAEPVDAVARIDNRYFTTLQAAANVAKDGETIVVLKNIETAETVDIKTAVTINGQGFQVKNTKQAHDAVAFNITAKGDVTFNKLNIYNPNGDAIEVNDGYNGQLTINNSKINSSRRAIDVQNVAEGFGLTVNSTEMTVIFKEKDGDGHDTYTVTTKDPKANYVNMISAGIYFANNAVAADVLIDKSLIQGFSYGVNVSNNSGKLNVTFSDGTFYGRAIVNNWGDYSTFNIDNMTVNGLNNEPTPGSELDYEKFATIVDNIDNINEDHRNGVANYNNYIINNSTFTANADNATAPAATEKFIDLRGNKAGVKITGNTTYTYTGTEADCGGFTNVEFFLNLVDENDVWFEEIAKGFFKPLVESFNGDAYGNITILDELDPVVNLYPIGRFSADVVMHVWDEAENETKYYFSDLDKALTSPQFGADVQIDLLKNQDLSYTDENGETVSKEYTIDVPFTLNLNVQTAGMDTYDDPSDDVFTPVTVKGVKFNLVPANSVTVIGGSTATDALFKVAEGYKDYAGIIKDGVEDPTYFAANVYNDGIDTYTYFDYLFDETRDETLMDDGYVRVETDFQLDQSLKVPSGVKKFYIDYNNGKKIDRDDYSIVLKPGQEVYTNADAEDLFSSADPEYTVMVDDVTVTKELINDKGTPETDDDVVVGTYSFTKKYYLMKDGLAVTVAPATYCGHEQTPTVIVKKRVEKEAPAEDEWITLTAGTDYEVKLVPSQAEDAYIAAKTYANSIIIEGKTFQGRRKADFIINPREISDVTVTGNEQPSRDNGYTRELIANAIAAEYGCIITEHKKDATTVMTYTLKKKGATTEKPDYVVTVDLAEGQRIYEIGTYKDLITVAALEGTEGTQNFVGSRKLDFVILPGDAINIANVLITSKAVYNSQTQIPSYESIEVTYKNGYNKVVLDPNQFKIEIHGMQHDYVDAKTYTNAITLKGTGKVGTTNSLKFYGTINADYVIMPRDLADTDFEDDKVQVVLEKNKDMDWTGEDLTNEIKIGDIAGANNIYFYMKVQTGDTYNGYRYVLTNDATTGKYDYSYTVEPSPMKDPGEYKVIFTGRGNFTGMREVKINVLKSIEDIAGGIKVNMQIIPNNYRLYVNDLKGIEVKDGDKTLVEGVHYTLEVKGARTNTAPYTYGKNFSDPNAANINPGETYYEYIQYKGLLYGFFKGKEPYYKDTVITEFPVVYEYYAYDNEETCYNKFTSGNYQSSGLVPNANKFSFRVKSGEMTPDGDTWKCEGEATVSAIDGIKGGTYSKTALDPAQEICTIDNEVVVAVGDQGAGTYKQIKFNIVGVEDNAFRDLQNLHCLDLTAVKGYTPDNLSRTNDGPFNHIRKQAIVYLDGEDANGENYVYKVADDDFRCEEFKIYDDYQGDQKGFTGDDYKWEIKNIYEFTAATLTNTRKFQKDQHYTTCLPYDLPLAETMKAYTLTAASAEIFGFREMEADATTGLKVLNAFTPYLLIPSVAGNLLNTTDVVVKKTTDLVNTKQIGGTPLPASGFTFYGSNAYIEKADAQNLYIMQSDKQWKKISANQSWNGPCVLPMRAYIMAPNNGSREFMGAKFIDAVEKTATDMAGDDWSDAEVYDLQGRKVDTTKSSMRKGVYIVNGQKRIRK